MFTVLLDISMQTKPSAREFSSSMWYLTSYYFSPVIELCNVYRSAQDKENVVALGTRRHRRSMHSPRTTAAVLRGSWNCGSPEKSRMHVYWLRFSRTSVTYKELLFRVNNFSRKKKNGTAIWRFLDALTFLVIVYWKKKLNFNKYLLNVNIYLIKSLIWFNYYFFYWNSYLL